MENHVLVYGYHDNLALFTTANVWRIFFHPLFSNIVPNPLHELSIRWYLVTSNDNCTGSSLVNTWALSQCMVVIPVTGASSCSFARLIWLFFHGTLAWTLPQIATYFRFVNMKYLYTSISQGFSNLFSQV